VPQVTDRDRLVLRDVWEHRYLTSAHLTRLHFRHAKLAQRRLRALTTAGVLRRFAPLEARRAGFQAWWYALSRAGARVVAAHTGLPLSATLPPTRVPRSVGFLAHHALVTDVRLWLAEACQASEGFAYDFLPSYDTVTPEGAHAPRVSLTLPDGRALFPDGAILLSRRERAALFFLEADRGTEPLTGRHPNALARKLDAYRAAYDARAEAQLAAHFPVPFDGFRLLWAVPDTTRQARVIALAREIDLAPLVWVTTHARLHERGRLDASVWAVTGASDVHALSE
jgi:protein involved in plasmid replication-relaxation